MTHEAPEFSACAVCERTILRGERAFEYRQEDGNVVAVCALCRDAAEARGWLPAELAGAEPAPGPEEGGRRQALRERLARVAERRHEQRAQAREEEAEPPQVEPRRLDEGPRTPERLVRTAFEYFNATDQPRKIAGLARSLGEPSVHATPDLERGRVEVVVAWELTWYRWAVAADGSVEQTGRGNELDELPEHERDWNASASETGHLRLETEDRAAE